MSKVRDYPQLNVRMRPDIVERLKAHAEEKGMTVVEALDRILDASVPALPKSFTQVKLRLGGDLYQRIQASAKNNQCSANAEITRRLESTFL